MEIGDSNHHREVDKQCHQGIRSTQAANPARGALLQEETMEEVEQPSAEEMQDSSERRDDEQFAEVSEGEQVCAWNESPFLEAPEESEFLCKPKKRSSKISSAGKMNNQPTADGRRWHLQRSASDEKRVTPHLSTVREGRRVK